MEPYVHLRGHHKIHFSQRKESFQMISLNCSTDMTADKVCVSRCPLSPVPSIWIEHKEEKSSAAEEQKQYEEQLSLNWSNDAGGRCLFWCPQTSGCSSHWSDSPADEMKMKNKTNQNKDIVYRFKEGAMSNRKILQTSLTFIFFLQEPLNLVLCFHNSFCLYHKRHKCDGFYVSLCLQLNCA